MDIQVPGTPDERRTFHYFRDRAAPEMAGYFNEGFWDRVLLQRTVSARSLRHAVVAVGSLHEKYATGNLAQANDVSDYYFAMQQYSRAVTSLRQDLQDANVPREVVLMSCILFTCFDSLRGEYDSALAHLRNGLNLLNSWLAEPNHTLEERLLVEKNIRPLFLRLGLQAILFVDDKAP
jgi:hypothetical protein